MRAMSAPILSLLSADALARHYRDGLWRDETVHAVAARHAAERPDEIALIDRWRQVSWRMLLALADALAADFAAHGLAPGQRVMLWLPGRIEIVAALLACSRAGLVSCPSPHRNHTVAEVAALAARTDAAGFLYQPGFGADAATADVPGALAALPSLRRTIALLPAGPGAPFAGLLADGPALPPASDANAVSYLAFTSGSTGLPKGVMHSDNTLLVCPRAIRDDWRVGAGSVVYSLSPFSHNLGMGAWLTALVAGVPFVIHDLAKGEGLVDRLIATGTTYLVGVPTHAVDLVAELDGRGMARCGRLAGFRVSGAAASRQVMEALLAHGITPQSGYGMTENNAHQYTLPGDDAARITGTSGRACRGYELCAFDAEDRDRPLPDGEIGEIGGRGASLMLGYFADQRATEHAFNRDGWFMTGDLGWIDSGGYLHLTGRKKDVIIRGGHNVNPARIEALALGHPDVAHAAALGVADDRLGERICLAVGVRSGARLTANSVCAHLDRAGLSRYEMPELFVAMEEMPLMANGKVQKAEIAALIRAGRVTPVPVRPAAAKG